MAQVNERTVNAAVRAEDQSLSPALQFDLADLRLLVVLPFAGTRDGPGQSGVEGLEQDAIAGTFRVAGPVEPDDIATRLRYLHFPDRVIILARAPAEVAVPLFKNDRFAVN